MNKIIKPQRKDWFELLKRPTTSIEDIEETVAQIFGEVRKNGDNALRKYTGYFDGIELNDFKIDSEEISTAGSRLSAELKDAITIAKSNIEKFHSAQRTQKVLVETMPGVVCWQEKRPIERVGLYIPGGSAPLFSTILMLAVPANLARCREIVLCTPPGRNGEVHPAILYTAELCGIKKIFSVGGIQAVGALTFGTETIPAVDKIFGPGNQYVTVAKQLATKFGVAIDMPAGPSELLIFADETGNPTFIASDLLSQAEHGVDSQVILVTTSEELLNHVEEQIALQLEELPRKSIAAKALQHSKLICLSSEEEALDLINEYGPEHFIVVGKNEDWFAENITNAGSVFIGDYTPESAGDYASGTNHTLPTNGYSRQYSGVNLDSFMKSITFQKLSREGIRNLGSSIERMAEAEGLQAHKNAVTLRLKSLEQ